MAPRNEEGWVAGVAGRLDAKVCVITGAGSGMGRVASHLFAREGAAVAALDVDLPSAQETARGVEASGGRALALRCDVRREAEVAAALDDAAQRFGGIDVLYNNAGIFPPEDHSVLDTDTAAWERVLAVNLVGTALVCKHGIPRLVARGGGSVVNVASFVALVGCTVPQDAYTASKGGVIALTKSLAVQFAKDRVRANAVCPGPIETPLLTSWLLADPEARRVRLARIPLGRFGRPEDVANLALFLASDESAWMTGSVIPIDGGITSFYF